MVSEEPMSGSQPWLHIRVTWGHELTSKSHFSRYSDLMDLEVAQEMGYFLMLPRWC